MEAINRSREIRRLLGIRGWLDVMKVAALLDLAVDIRSFRGRNVQEITIGKSIAVGDHLRLHQRRWAIAHGIGHTVLHRDSPNHVWLNMNDRFPDKFELEAEYFAFHLLVDDSLNAGLTENWELAAHYGIPISKMSFRPFGGFE